MSRHPIVVIGLTLAWIAACASTTGGGGSNTNWIRCESDQGCYGGQICVERRCVIKSSSSATVEGAPISGDASASASVSADRRRDAGVDMVRDASPARSRGASPDPRSVADAEAGVRALSPFPDGGALGGICRVPGATNGTSCDDLDPNTVGDSCTDGVCGGSYVRRCETSGEGGAFACHDAFSLVGAYWDGSVEPVDLVSASTGRGVQKGVLGDLYEWSDQIVETADARRVVAIGANGAGLSKLYVLDMQSGLTNSVPIGREYALAGALASGALVGADAREGSVLSVDVDVIDPATGSAVPAGTIEGIDSWGRQLALDVPRHRVYTIASPTTDPSSFRLYSFDLSNGASTSQPLAWGVFLGGVASDGQIVMSKNWPTSWFVGLIDPDTMAVTWKGQMGDMYAGSYLVYDPTTHVAHTVGVDQAFNSYLYTFDLARNVSTKVPTKSGYVLAKRASEGAETGNTNGDGG